MAATCVRHTDLPHTSRLFADFLYHFDRVAGFYEHPPQDWAAYREAATQVTLSPERRAAMVSALRSLNGDSPHLDRLAQPDTVAVITGQQVGLFGGPAYTIYKALTAVRLAQELTSQGVPAVPLFWLATEDHDLAEVDHCWVFGPDHRPVRVQASADASGLEMVGGVALPHPPHEALRESMGRLPFADEVLALVAESYPAGQTLGGGFLSLLQRLLQPYGLLFVDPTHPEMRALMAPLLRQAVERSGDLVPLLLQRNQALEAAKYHAQVHVESHTALFFLVENGRRIALKRQNGNFASRDRTYTAQELADRAPELSPNALLRPVAQDSVFPTVAYIGGPAELAYFAQSQVLYRQLLGRMPVVAPRSGYTLVDAGTAKRMRKYGLSLSSFYGGEEALQGRIAERLVPPEVEQELASVHAELQGSLGRLRGSVERFDPTLADALDTSRAKMEHQLRKMRQKVAREAMRRNERARHDAASLYGLLFPEKTLQERLYSMLPFLAWHGLELLPFLHGSVHLQCPDHVLLNV